MTVQAQVLDLLARLCDEIGCSFVFVTHDLGVAAQISDRIAVLYGGPHRGGRPHREVLERPRTRTHTACCVRASPSMHGS